MSYFTQRPPTLPHIVGRFIMLGAWDIPNPIRDKVVIATVEKVQADRDKKKIIIIIIIKKRIRIVSETKMQK